MSGEPAVAAITSDLLRSVFLSMTEGVVVHLRDGSVVEANPAAERILGLSRERILGLTSVDPSWRTLREDGSDFPGEEHAAMVTMRTGQPVLNQVMGIHPPGGGLRWISINSQPIVADGETIAVIATFIDITAQQQLNAQLRTARLDLEAILDNVPARITSWHADNTNRFANRVAAQEFGLNDRDVTGRHARDILGEERYAQAVRYMEGAFAGKRQSFEQAERQPDGSFRHTRMSIVPMLRGESVVGVYALATDITELRESYLSIRELARRLETVREEERRAIAQTLHEGVAQDLFAAKLALKQLVAHAGAGADDERVASEVGAALDRCMAATRQVANDLRPSGLAHLDLAAALEEHARFFAQLTGLQISVEDDPAFPVLDETRSFVLYRAAQEALTNAARHAQARKLRVALRAEPGWATMTIQDDGIGIQPAALRKAGSLGLLGIRERLATLNGTFEIVGQPGLGSTMTLRLPTG
jgi:PAS domain S-box-containing protein